MAKLGKTDYAFIAIWIVLTVGVIGLGTVLDWWRVLDCLTPAALDC